LEVLSVNEVPEMKVEAEWPGYSVHLNQKQQVLRGRNLWQGANDLSAKLRAVNKGDDLFLRAEVIDNQVTPGDTVRLVAKKGLAIKPKESKLLRTEKGYVFLGRYSLNEIARVLKPADKYIVENLEMVLDPNSVYGDLQGFQLPVSVEVVDVDSPRSEVRGVLSTRLAGSPYAGSMTLFRPGRLFLTTDTGQ
jgi:hypothetical protein